MSSKDQQAYVTPQLDNAYISEMCFKIWTNYQRCMSKIIYPLPTDPTGRHICNISTEAPCDIQNIPLKIYLFDYSVLANIIDQQVAAIRDDTDGVDVPCEDVVRKELLNDAFIDTVRLNEGLGIHYCTSYCRTSDRPDFRFIHASLYKRYHNIYLCSESWKVHICDETCTEHRIQDDGGNRMCSVSNILKSHTQGATFGDGTYDPTLSVRKTKDYVICPKTMKRRRIAAVASTSALQVPGAVPAGVARSRSQMIAPSGSTGTLACGAEDNPNILTHDEVANLKTLDAFLKRTDLVADYASVSQHVDQLLFGDRKISLRCAKLTKAAEKGEKQTDKYIKRRKASGGLLRYADASAAYRSKFFEVYVPPLMQTSQEMKKRLIQHYSLAVLAFINNIQNNLIDLALDVEMCTVPILYWFTKDFCIGDTRIWQMDDILTFVLPEANTIDEYKIDKTSITRIQTQLQTSIINSVNQRVISPRVLQIHMLTCDQLNDDRMPVWMSFVKQNRHAFVCKR